MIVREIVLTCSNPHVARAAVLSIGGDFARRFSSDAAKRNLKSGAFPALLGQRFSRQAGHGDWEGVGRAARGADQPILSGLRYILDRVRELDEDDCDPVEDWRPALPSFSLCEAWRH